MTSGDPGDLSFWGRGGLGGAIVLFVASIIGWVVYAAKRARERDERNGGESGP